MYKYIYIYPSAYGKVPHVVAERDLHGWGFQRRVAKRAPNVAKRAPKDAKRNQKGPKMEPRGAKGSQKGPKGRQKGTKGGPKGIQKSAWVPGSIFDAKRSCRQRVLGRHFWSIFRSKSRSKIEAKTDVEKHDF